MKCHPRLLRWWVGLGSILSALASFTTVRPDDSSWSRVTQVLSAGRTTFTDYERSSSSSLSETAAPLFYHSVPTGTFGSTQPNDWKILCPPVWNSKETRDVTIQWSCCEDPTVVATRLFQRLDPSSVPVDSTSSSRSTSSTRGTSPLVITLAQAMTYFRDFCFDHLNGPHQEDNHGFQFKCRLVTTRGSTGTKCPQWHTDHVPIRWIQAMVGPGCEWVVGDDGVNWTTMKNGFDDENQDGGFVRVSVQDRNRALVQDSVATIYSTHEQEAVILLGNQWPKYAKHRVDATTFKPVIHKSPTIPWGCERVLLTQDVLFHED